AIAPLVVPEGIVCVEGNEIEGTWHRFVAARGCRARGQRLERQTITERANSSGFTSARSPSTLTNCFASSNDSALKSSRQASSSVVVAFMSKVERPPSTISQRSGSRVIVQVPADGPV